MTTHVVTDESREFSLRTRSSRLGLSNPVANTYAVELTEVDSDRELIGRAVAGDHDAFGALVGRTSDHLYRYILKMTGSPDVADDILQTSFIKAYRHLGKVRGQFDAWLFRIVVNGCKDWLKDIRRSHLSYDSDDLMSSLNTPDRDLDRVELRADLNRAMVELEPSHREAFVMRHVEGRSYEEMAELLATTVGALKMRVYRARVVLQARLQDKYARC